MASPTTPAAPAPRTTPVPPTVPTLTLPPPATLPTPGTTPATVNQPAAKTWLYAVVAIIAAILLLWVMGKVESLHKTIKEEMVSVTHSVSSWFSKKSEAPQQVSWERAPDGAETVTLYPGQWSSTLELQFEHSWNLHFDSDVTLVLNGSNVVSLGRDQRVPSNDNIHTIKVRNNGRVKMTYIVTYGAPYRTPRYYHQQVQQPPERRYYANPQYNSPRYYRLSYKRY